MKSVSSSDLSAAYRAPEPSSAGANAFGGPRRRGTDVLMAINVAVFLAQFVSKDKLLLMGAKVVLLLLPASSFISWGLSPMSDVHSHAPQFRHRMLTVNCCHAVSSHSACCQASDPVLP